MQESVRKPLYRPRIHLCKERLQAGTDSFEPNPLHRGIEGLYQDSLGRRNKGGALLAQHEDDGRTTSVRSFYPSTPIIHRTKEQDQGYRPRKNCLQQGIYPRIR